MSAAFALAIGMWSIAVGLIFEFVGADGRLPIVGGLCLLVGTVAGLSSTKGVA
jgi:hypothetical protein